MKFTSCDIWFAPSAMLKFSGGPGAKGKKKKCHEVCYCRSRFHSDHEDTVD